MTADQQGARTKRKADQAPFARLAVADELGLLKGSPRAPVHC